MLVFESAGARLCLINYNLDDPLTVFPLDITPQESRRMKTKAFRGSIGAFLCFSALPSLLLAQQSTSTKPEVGILEHRVETVAIKNATVVTEPGKQLEMATIVIRDGKIAEIGTNVQAPKEAVVIDLAGKTVYPGFVDAGVESELPPVDATRGAPHWSADITPERSAATSLASNDATLAKLRKAGITAALIAPRDGIIKGTSAVVLTSDDTVANSVLRDNVALHVRLTTSRRGRDSYPGSPMGAVALARQTFLDAQWHQQAWQIYRSQSGIERPEANAALDAIQQHLSAGKYVVFDALNEQYALRADSFGREFGLNVVLRGSGQEYQLLDKIAKLHRPIIVPLNFPKPPNVATADAALDTELEELVHWELAPENPARLAKAGVKIVLTSNGLNDASEFIPAIRKAIARGLDKTVALEAITTTPASLLGVENDCGSIKPGAWANLVVTNGDLWEEKTKIEEVWVRGVRPNSAFKVESNADGKWKLTLSSSKEKENSRPSELILTVADSAKKVSGTLALVEAPKSETEKPKSEDAKPDETKKTDPAITKPDETKPDEVKPEEADPSKAKVSGEKPVDPKAPPTQDKPEETKKPDESKPDQPKVTGEKPGSEKPATEPPVPGKPEDDPENPNKNKPTDTKAPAEDKSKKKDKEEKGKAKLRSPRWEDRTLSANFSASSLVDNENGVAYLSLAMIPTEGDETTLVGTIQWPDGERQSFTASKNKEGDKEKKDSDKKEGDKKEGDKKDEAKSEESKKGDGAKRDGESSDKDKKPSSKVLSTVQYPPGVLGRSGLPEQPDYVVFQNTTIWTSGPVGVLKDADLIVHRGVIHEVGVDLKVPEGATVIDASQWQLSPGLIDCHSHMASDSGINESTQAVTAEVRIGDFIDAGDITVYRQLAGGLTSANILHGSANPIGGQNQVIKLRWGGTFEDLKFEDAPAGIKFALGENVKQSNWEGPKTRYPQSRMGVEQLMRDRFNSAREYDAAWKRWNKERTGLPPRRDLELDAISEILRGERWIHCHSYRQDEILGLLRVLEDYNVKIGSLQHILEGYKVADAIAKHGATASSFSDWWAYKFEVWDAIPYNGALMHNQGIVVSFNSDDAELGRHMNHEAAKAMKYGGIEATEALKFVTLNPAKQLRIDDKVGSIEVGKHADIAIWNGSPLSPMSRCEQTWIDGRKYFDRNEDAEMRKRDSELRQGLIQKVIDSGEAAGERSSLADDPSRLWPNHDEFCHHHHDESDHDMDYADHGEHVHHEHE